MSLTSWTFVKRELLTQTRIYRLLAEWWRSPRTGQEHTFSVIDSADWVNVVALDTQGRMILIRQFRFGTGRFTLEVPGGMVDPGEDPQASAIRELREETGYAGTRVTSLGFAEPNPAIINNKVHMFLVEGCERVGELVLDAGEDIEVVPTNVQDVRRMVRTGEISHALVAVALQRFELYRAGELRLGGIG